MKTVGNKVIVKLEEGKTKTDSGIVLANPELTPFAEVIAIGPKVTEVVVGDRIVLDPRMEKVNDITVENKRYLVVRADVDILAVFDKWS